MGAMWAARKPFRALIVAALAVGAVAGDAQAATLDRIKSTGEFKIGYRDDAVPFSFKTAIGEAAGYSVDLCRAVAAHAKQTLGLAELKVTYVPVTAEGRFDAIRDGRVDLLCGATTATLGRRKMVDFSIPVFVDGASVLYRADGPGGFEALAGKSVGVRAGTTTENALDITLKRLGIDVQVVAVDDHQDGLAKLEAGTISAYFADRAILLFLAAGSTKPEMLKLSQRYYTYEPYALAMLRGDDEMRLLVDRALSRLYRSGAIEGLFAGSFGPGAKPSEPLKMLYLINALPE